jgi:hypothetical protein
MGMAVALGVAATLGCGGEEDDSTDDVNNPSLGGAPSRTNTTVGGTHAQTSLASGGTTQRIFSMPAYGVAPNGGAGGTTTNGGGMATAYGAPPAGGATNSSGGMATAYGAPPAGGTKSTTTQTIHAVPVYGVAPSSK